MDICSKSHHRKMLAPFVSFQFNYNRQNNNQSGFRVGRTPTPRYAV